MIFNKLGSAQFHINPVQISDSTYKMIDVDCFKLSELPPSLLNTPSFDEEDPNSYLGIRKLLNTDAILEINAGALRPSEGSDDFTFNYGLIESLNFPKCTTLDTQCLAKFSRVESAKEIGEEFGLNPYYPANFEKVENVNMYALEGALIQDLSLPSLKDLLPQGIYDGNFETIYLGENLNALVDTGSYPQLREITQPVTFISDWFSKCLSLDKVTFTRGIQIFLQLNELLDYNRLYSVKEFNLEAADNVKVITGMMASYKAILPYSVNLPSLNKITMPDSIEVINSLLPKTLYLKKDDITNNIKTTDKCYFLKGNENEKLVLLGVRQDVSVSELTEEDLLGCKVLGNLGPFTGPLTIPEGVTDISPSAFADWKCYAGPTGITFPTTLKHVGANIFSLTGVNYLSITHLSTDNNHYAGEGFEVQAGNIYSNNNQTYPTSFSVNSNVRILTDVKGYSYNSWPELNFSCPTVLEIIADGAFFSNKQLRRVTFNEGLKTIGDFAFTGCDSLFHSYVDYDHSFKLPNSLEYLGESAFYGLHLASYDKFVIPSNVEHLGKNALPNGFCKNLYIDSPYDLLIPLETVNLSLGGAIYTKCSGEPNFGAYHYAMKLDEITPDGYKKYVPIVRMW